MAEEVPAAEGEAAAEEEEGEAAPEARAERGQEAEEAAGRPDEGS
jgi:hypothetical protein